MGSSSHMSRCLSLSVLLSVLADRPHEGSVLPLFTWGFHLCSQWSSAPDPALPARCHRKGEHRSAMPSHPSPERRRTEPGHPNQPVFPRPEHPGHQRWAENCPLPPQTLAETRSPLISTRANLTSFLAHMGQNTALPPKEGQEPRVGSWLSLLFLSQGTGRYDGLQDRAGASKPDPMPWRRWGH